MNSENGSFHEQHPWMEHAPKNPDDYLDPEYYDRILKDYCFSGKSDLELLDQYLDQLPSRSNVLELGCGSGRATDQIVRRSGQVTALDLVDLSSGMTEYCRSKYKEQPQVQVHQSDSIDYLRNYTGEYTSVVSLWNLSHSVHQHMFRLGREAGSEYVANSLYKFVTTNLERSGTMYLIHYDIQSPEQRLINPWRLKLWTEADPDYDAQNQSPSKELLDTVFTRLQDDKVITYTCTHLTGDPIEYPSKEVALETFLNFHMEGYFNQKPELPDVAESLMEGFEPYTDVHGAVRIPPGAFEYTITRT